MNVALYILLWLTFMAACAAIAAVIVDKVFIDNDSDTYE